MKNRKSIDDLISSIYNLVNEAKREYESINKIDLNQSVTFEKRETKGGNNEEFKTSSNQQYYSEPKQIVNKEDDLVNWKNIEFNKDANKTSEINNDSNKVMNLENEMIKEKFNSSLNIWIAKNLQRLIELEFANYLRFRNDQ